MFETTPTVGAMPLHEIVVTDAIILATLPHRGWLRLALVPWRLVPAALSLIMVIDRWHASLNFIVALSPTIVATWGTWWVVAWIASMATPAVALP